MTYEEQKRIFSKNINYYISQSGIPQKDIAKTLGFNPTTFNTWCVGKIIPNTCKIQKIADYFRIRKSDLLDDKSSLQGKEMRKGVAINVLNRITSNLPMEAIENIIDTEEISEQLASTGDFFGLQIHDDNMEPRIYENDVVIVRKQNDAESGDIVITTVNGNDATCKRLMKYAGSIALLSLNPKYKPTVFSEKEIKEKSVRIIGKVTELRGKL